MKSCSCDPKTCKSVRNPKSKFFTVPVLSSYTEENKNYFKVLSSKNAHINGIEDNWYNEIYIMQIVFSIPEEILLLCQIFCTVHTVEYLTDIFSIFISHYVS